MNQKSLKINFSLCGPTFRYFCLFINLSCLSYGASLGAIEDGIKAFREGNYSIARPIFIEAASTENKLTAQAYIWAMEDKPTAPDVDLIGFIMEASARNTNFQVMEGQLHLLGHHPAPDKEKGLRLIKSLSIEDDPYALFTLARHYEGAFGAKQQLTLAKQYYKMAKGYGFQLAEKHRKAIKAMEDRAAKGDPIGDGGSTWKKGMDVARGVEDLERGSVYSGKSGAPKKDMYKRQTEIKKENIIVESSTGAVDARSLLAAEYGAVTSGGTASAGSVDKIDQADKAVQPLAATTVTSLSNDRQVSFISSKPNEEHAKCCECIIA